MEEGTEERREEERRQTAREISFVPFAVSLCYAESGWLSCFRCSSVPLSGCFIRCIGRTWGVTNPSRIRIAAPTVGIRRAIGPYDTRKPNGKRKYDADFRSVKRIRETLDRAGLLSVSPAHLHALYIHPRCTENEFSLFPSTSAVSLSFLPQSLSPHLFAVTSECWKLDDWSRNRRLGLIGRSQFSFFHRKGKRSFAIACLLA